MHFMASALDCNLQCVFCPKLARHFSTWTWRSRANYEYIGFFPHFWSKIIKSNNTQTLKQTNAHRRKTHSVPRSNTFVLNRQSLRVTNPNLVKPTPFPKQIFQRFSNAPSQVELKRYHSAVSGFKAPCSQYPATADSATSSGCGAGHCGHNSHHDLPGKFPTTRSRKESKRGVRRFISGLSTPCRFIASLGGDARMLPRTDISNQLPALPPQLVTANRPVFVCQSVGLRLVEGSRGGGGQAQPLG